MDLEAVIDRYRVTDGSGFRLDRHDPADEGGGLVTVDKKQARDLLRAGVERLGELQDMLYAQDRWAVLLVFQAMDAAGKDSAIKHVMSGVNPQGVQVHSFKQPSAEELDHDYLWRAVRALPERGRIGVFNRSYYEEVLVVRVHEERMLRAAKLPLELVTPDIWRQRHEDVANFERYLARNGTLILKFFLNVSREEQKRRFLSRLDEPEKNWKFSPSDVAERGHWDAYMAAYEDAIRATAAPHAPWYVIPADRKWYTRLVVNAEIVKAMGRLDLHYPRVDPGQRAALDEARRMLEAERGGREALPDGGAVACPKPRS